MSQKILIIDDQPRICTLLKEVFKDEYEVYIATEPKKAIEIVEGEQPDLAIVDMNLGQDHGLDLMEEMLKKKSDLLLTILTGYCSDEEKQRGEEIGVKAFLQKPFDVLELRECIASILDTK